MSPWCSSSRCWRWGCVSCSRDCAGGLGIVTGIEALHYTSKVGPSGDDFTGLLAVPAGLGLLGLGTATLWRTRRTGASRAARYLRRALLGLLGAAVALFVVAPLSGGYL